MAKSVEKLRSPNQTDQQRLDLLANLILEILENETVEEDSHEND